MTWAQAFPNLLVGLREGLEAGLVVSILLAAVRKSVGAASSETGGGTRDGGRGGLSTAPVWLGVVAACALSGSFAAVLTFSTAALSGRAQEAVGGALSVVAVVLVTVMVFWMRRTARTLSRQLRSEVERATVIGGGALALTAFLAVGREGLETTLFLWAAAKASASTWSPLVGAAIGVTVAVVICVLLYRQAVRIDLGVFFTRTAILLIVVAAGVLAYGLGDLQESGLLPGAQWVAFDLSRHVDTGSWWVSLVSGVTNLSPKMTVLQITAWIGYLAVVVWSFVHAGRTAPAPAPSPAPAASGSRAQTPTAGRWERLAGRRPWTVGAVLITAPASVAALVIVVLPSQAAAAATAVAVTDTGCATGWSTARPGSQTFTVTNSARVAGEVNLVDAAGGVVGEIETLGPGTTAPLQATLGPGTYQFRCLLNGKPVMASASLTVTGGAPASTTAVEPVTVAELTGPNTAYQAYAATQLDALATQVQVLAADLGRGDLAAARADWPAAQVDWELVGASYDSFGDDGTAVDGLSGGLPGGVDDPGFTGLHRLEYGLWHGQDAATLLPVVTRLAADVTTVRDHLTDDDLAGDPTNLPIRAHEILEDALRDHLSGLDDNGSGTAYQTTAADVQVTRTVLSELTALITARDPELLPAVDTQLNQLETALDATRSGTTWQPAGQVALSQRQAVDGALGAVLEQLSAVPDLLEVPPTS